VLLLMGLAFGALFAWVTHTDRLLGRLPPPGVVRAARRRFMLGLVVYAAAFGLSWVSAPLALALCGLMALYYAFDQASVPAAAVEPDDNSPPDGHEESPDPRIEPSVIEEALPGAERRQRDRRALEVVERRRLRSEQARRDGGVPGCDAIAIELGMPRPWRGEGLAKRRQVVPSSWAARPGRRRARPRSDRPGSGWTASPPAAGHARPHWPPPGSVQPAFGARELTRTRLFHRSWRPCRVTCLGHCPVDVQDRPPVSASRACWVRRAMIVLPLPS
jgi:hypothetical protein